MLQDPMGRGLAAAVSEAAPGLGPLHAAGCRAEVVDTTPRGPVDGGSTAGPSSRNAVVPAQPPKLELEVPYRMYRVTRVDGTVPDRVDKHPFCMSRVYYDASEKPEEVRGLVAAGALSKSAGDGVGDVCVCVCVCVQGCLGLGCGTPLWIGQTCGRARATPAHLSASPLRILPPSCPNTEILLALAAVGRAG